MFAILCLNSYKHNFILDTHIRIQILFTDLFQKIVYTYYHRFSLVVSAHKKYHREQYPITNTSP